MNTNLVRTNGGVGSWPILVIYAAFVISFVIAALTMASTLIVA